MVCIRGAITIKNNVAEEIISATRELISEIIEKNSISIEKIIRIDFSATEDIDAVYPAAGVREIGITDAALMCFQEMKVADSLGLCIRAALFAELDITQNQVKHIYLKDAQLLRPDIVMNSEIFAIAIDGPAGSGKSTVAKALSKKLNILYVDTGAMYRAVAYYCLQKGIDTKSEEKVTSILDEISMDIEIFEGTQHIILNGKDITDDMRTKEIGQGASDVGTILSVREKLVYIQQNIAKGKSVVMDGRDIGTAVLPNAKYKIYLTADLKERARRRYEEFKLTGSKDSLEDVIKQISIRDKNDMEREHNPLKKAEDAWELDSTKLSVKETIDSILRYIIGR